MLIIWCLESPVAVVHYFMSIVFIMDQLTQGSYLLLCDWIGSYQIIVRFHLMFIQWI